MSRDDANDGSQEHIDRLVERLEDMGSCPLIADLAIHLQKVKKDLRVVQCVVNGTEILFGG